MPSSWVHVHVNPFSGALIAQQHFEAPQHCKKPEKQDLHPCFYFSETLIAQKKKEKLLHNLTMKCTVASKRPPTTPPVLISSAMVDAVSKSVMLKSLHSLKNTPEAPTVLQSLHRRNLAVVWGHLMPHIIPQGNTFSLASRVIPYPGKVLL